jgi:hypothetical protein
MSDIQCKIIDSTLYSGSTDIFRTANGGYWYEALVHGEAVDSFESTNVDSPDFKYFDKILLSNIHELVDNEIITPSKRFATRIVSSNSDIKGDEEWNKIWLGGNFGPQSHSPIYSTDSFQYVYFTHSQPYPQLSASLLTGDFASSVIQISYDYRNYLKEYEEYVTLNPEVSELSLPNYYVMADMSVWDMEAVPGAIDLYTTELKNYLTRHNTIDFTINSFFSRNLSSLSGLADDPPPAWMWEAEGGLTTKNNNMAIEYLTSSYIQNSLSSSTEKWVASKMKALLFDADAMGVLRETAGYAPAAHTRLPYNMKITFPTNNSGEFTTSLIANGLDSKFIKTLYETFSGISTELSIVEQEYNYAAAYYSADVLGGQISSVHEKEARTFREIDYVQLLINTHNSYKNATINDEYMFVGPRTMQRYAAETTSSAYRYINTQGALRTLTDVMTYISENPEETEVTEWSDLYAETPRHYETIAYRVEKKGGAGSGDSNTQKALQNFWFLNTRTAPDAATGASTEFTFYDSQVKYDTDYTYQIYEYVLVQGMRYKFSDLKLSRQIGCEDSAHRVGIEFYEPTGSNTGDKAPRLMMGDTSLYPTKFAALSGTFLTDSHVYSEYPYAADFYINYEPVFKIIEIPSHKKKLKILDYLPNAYRVTPYGLTGTSNKIGFDLVYAASSEPTYPPAVTEDDAAYKAAYLNANDLTDSMIVADTTVTAPVAIEVYRMTTRPREMAEFQYYLHDTIDLKMAGQKYVTQGGAIFHDKVAPNTKYYYLFKGINVHGTQSYLTPVYEAQLVDDGGYAYAVFNTLTESELEEKIYTNPTKHFKNLLQLQPNMDQLTLDTTDADFGKSAASEIANIGVGSADDLIWDKTFKVRLTSKKTGKKIDFNITYNLKSE